MMDAQAMQTYLQMLGDELLQHGVTGEIVLAGGAVMLLAVITRYVPASQITPKTQYLIQTLFP